MSKKFKPKVIEYNPVNNIHGYTVRWVENVSRGLRLVGFADKIVRLTHRGWYTDEDGSNGEVYRGVVYQLPKGRYAYGYADPCNDDCALLCFDVMEDKEDAARAADQLAETFAEHERNYNEAWQAGRKYEDFADEIVDMRKQALSIGQEMRAARKAKVTAPTICATLRTEILSLYRRIQKARRKRAELLADFGRCAGFKG